MTHGVPRTTQDLDIVIDPSAASLDQFLRELDPDRFYVNSERQLVDVAGILRVRSTNLDLDYIERWVDALDLRLQWDRARRFTT